MAVNRNIGLLTGIINGVKSLSARVNINPIAPIADKKIDYNMLKTSVVTRPTENTQNVFHWSFHRWGDKNNLVGS